MSLSIIFQIIVCLLIIFLLLKVQSKNFKKYMYSKKNKNIVYKMSGLEFENYVSSIFYRMGYKNRITKGSYDFGADIILSNQNKVIVIQAKRYKNSVGIKAIQEVFTAKFYYDAHDCYVVTNSEFTKSAKMLAKKIGVNLINGQDLKYLEKRYIDKNKEYQLL